MHHHRVLRHARHVGTRERSLGVDRFFHLGVDRARPDVELERAGRRALLLVLHAHDPRAFVLVGVEAVHLALLAGRLDVEAIGRDAGSAALLGLLPRLLGLLRLGLAGLLGTGGHRAALDRALEVFLVPKNETLFPKIGIIRFFGNSALLEPFVRSSGFSRSVCLKAELQTAWRYRIKVKCHDA